MSDEEGVTNPTGWWDVSYPVHHWNNSVVTDCGIDYTKGDVAYTSAWMWVDCIACVEGAGSY